MLAAEDDPEGEQHGVEDALPDVSKKQHPGPVEADGEPLHGDVDERHGDTESEDYPGGAETPRRYTILLSINKTSARITEEHLDGRRRIDGTREPLCTQANVLLDGVGRLNLGSDLGRFYT